MIGRRCVVASGEPAEQQRFETFDAKRDSTWTSHILVVTASFLGNPSFLLQGKATSVEMSTIFRRKLRRCTPDI